MKNKKKILSLVLVAALVVSVCLMGGILNASAAATVIDEGNLLLNGSFEQTYDANLGFTDLEIKNGQANYVGVDAWRYCSHWWVDGVVTYTEKKIYATHFTDAHSGSFALKFTNPGTGETPEGSVTIYPNKVVGEDATAFATGNYRFSVWVKGTNTASSIVYTNAAGTKNTVNISDVKADEWTQVVIENIAGFSTVDREPTNPKVTETVLDLNFVINTQDTATEILFDDAKLELMSEEEVHPNLIIDSGIESQTTKQSSIGHGHKAPLTENWAGFNWKATKYVTFGVAAEGVTGNALKFTVPNSGNTLKAYVRTSGINLDNITAGYYKLTAYVKTNNTKSYMYVGTSNSATFTADGQWNKVTLENVQLTDSGANLTAVVDDDGNVNGNGYELGFNIVPDTTATGDTYVLIDDISLVKQEETLAPVVNNMLSNASFETTTQVWNASANKSGWDGFTDRQVAKGQSNVLVDDWRFNRWNSDTVHPYVTHTTDKHTGTYALKFRIPAGCAESVLYPRADKIDLSSVQAGYYTLSLWVKGTNTASSLSVKCTSSATGNGEITYTQSIPASNDWTLVTLDNIYLTAGAANLANYGGNTAGPAIRVNIKAASGDTGDTDIYIDDINLEKIDIDTIDEVKGQITGIKQPAVGATELELPVLDTNNSNISVSIAASSDEDVIALDGTITTPKMQTVVDVTLKISDGTNEVTLDPIGVLVHGELDTTTQAVIEKAIADLDTKAETFAADASQIDEWLEYKSGYVSAASKNLFAQKKLVFEFDKSGDTVLDKDDIVAVREELLGENTKDYTIRDLVKTFNKVVEYNSLAQ